MSDLNIVAHMVERNEADVIAEVVNEIMRWVDTLVVLDGASDDGTMDKLWELGEKWVGRGKKLRIVSEPDPDDTFRGHIRNRLLELTAEHRPDWVFSVDADEIYDSYYDHKKNLVTPITAIERADACGANVVRCLVPQFWLTLADLRGGALTEDPHLPVQQRRRWYSWGHMGTFIWKWNDAHYYPQDVSKRTPELPGLTWRQWQIAGPWMPICKHYCFRSIEQGVRRAAERRERGGRKYFGKYFENWIIDEQVAGLHYLDPIGDWCTENNHDGVGWYMSGQWRET